MKLIVNQGHPDIGDHSCEAPPFRASCTDFPKDGDSRDCHARATALGAHKATVSQPAPRARARRRGDQPYPIVVHQPDFALSPQARGINQYPAEEGPYANWVTPQARG